MWFWKTPAGTYLSSSTTKYVKNPAKIFLVWELSGIFTYQKHRQRLLYCSKTVEIVTEYKRCLEALQFFVQFLKLLITLKKPLKTVNQWSAVLVREKLLVLTPWSSSITGVGWGPVVPWGNMASFSPQECFSWQAQPCMAWQYNLCRCNPMPSSAYLEEGGGMMFPPTPGVDRGGGLVNMPPG